MTRRAIDCRPTGRRRNLLGFIGQIEVEGPVWCGRSQTPFNVQSWPRGRWWMTVSLFGMPWGRGDFGD